jgi:hypothetical protein
MDALIDFLNWAWSRQWAGAALVIVAGTALKVAWSFDVGCGGHDRAQAFNEA